MTHSKRKKFGILGALIVSLLITMTISDIYYSDLAEKYPVLDPKEFLEGQITDLKIHHRYTFVEIDHNKKRNIPPSFLYAPKTDYFHKMIAIGDHFFHEANSTDVSLEKQGVVYKYLVSRIKI